MKVKFLSTTITSKGRFEKGDEVEFPDKEAKDLQRLTSVESPVPAPSVTVKKKKKKKTEEDGV